MSHPGDLNERIEAEAAAWMVKVTSGQATSGDLARLRVWRRQSPAHEAAFLFAQQTWRDLEALRGELPLASTESDAQVPPSAQARFLLCTPARRVFLSAWTTAAVMIISVGLAFYAANPIAWLRADYHTTTGEVQQLSLPDGTTAHLNTTSAIALHFGEQERRVEVLYGEAAFSVAREKSRPFIVETFEVEMRALGTRFVVRADQGQVQVTVLHHQVAVSTPNDLPRVIRRGQTVRCDASSRCGPVTAVNLSSASAWQRGKLIFDRVPLSAVIAELQRYRHGFVVLASNQLAQRRVSGMFRLDELDAALDTIITELKIKATRLPFVTLLH